MTLWSRAVRRFRLVSRPLVEPFYYKLVGSLHALNRSLVEDAHPNSADLLKTSLYRDASIHRQHEIISNPMLPLEEEMEEWLASNTTGKWERRGSYISFENADDAMMFKLRWM